MKTYAEIKKEVDCFLDSQHDTEIVENNYFTLPEMLSLLEQKPEPEKIQIGTMKRLTEALGGFRMNEFTILCGPSGYGKTTFLANMAMGLVASGINSFMASIEIGALEFYKKMVSSAGRFPISEMSTKGVDFVKKNESLFFYSQDHIFAKYESRVNHRNLIYDLYWAHHNCGTKVALIDNMNYILEPSSANNQLAIMDKVIHEWIVAVKNIDLHVVMVMHPRKTESGRVDSMYEIKGSSTAIQEAQNVLLFNSLLKAENTPMLAAPAFCRELEIAKCRFNGKSRGSKIIFSQDKNSEQYIEESIV